MIKPATYTFNAQLRGSYMNWPTFQVLNSNGVTIDLTGADVDIWWRKGGVDGEIVRVYSTEDDSIDMTDAASGIVKMLAETLDWPAGTYRSDVQIRIAGNPYKRLILNLSIIEAATRETYM